MTSMSNRTTGFPFPIVRQLYTRKQLQIQFDVDKDCFCDDDQLQRPSAVRLQHPYECDICAKTFTHGASLIKHKINVHENARRHGCDMCEKSFPHCEFLRRHRRIHTNERPYQCETCVKSFKVKSDLHRHHRTHTKEKPYTCALCAKTFTQSGDLRRHERNVHKQ